MKSELMLMDEQEMTDVLRQFVKQYETQIEAARVLSVSPVFLGDLLKGRKPVTPRIAGQLGFIRKWWYEPMV